MTGFRAAAAPETKTSRLRLEVAKIFLPKHNITSNETSDRYRVRPLSLTVSMTTAAAAAAAAAAATTTVADRERID
jgi:hypothetical protein